MKTRFRRAVLFLLGVIVVAAPTASANARLGGGETLFYARVENGEIFHTDQWAKVAFYRPPACEPCFKLLALFGVPAAFACGPSTIDDFTIWRSGRKTDAAPIEAGFRGLGAGADLVRLLARGQGGGRGKTSCIERPAMKKPKRRDR